MLQPETAFNTFKALPKADCHVHLTGALGPSDLRELAAVTGIDVGPDEPLGDLMTFTNQRIWPLAKELTSHPAGLATSLSILAARAAQDNVKRLEVTINPASMRTHYGLTMPDFVAATAEAVDQAQRTIGRTLAHKMRREPPGRPRECGGRRGILHGSASRASRFYRSQW